MIVHDQIPHDVNGYIYDDLTINQLAFHWDDIQYMGGSRCLGCPSYLYYNGYFYLVGYKSNTNSDNQIVLIKYNRYSDFVIKNVGSGTTPGNEPNGHPTPAIYINESTGYVYVIQNKYHNSYFRVWKSTEPEGTEFTLLGEMSNGGASYFSIIERNGSDVTFVTRGKTGGNNNLWYCFACCTVNLDTLSYTHTQITSIDFATNQTRHYPNASPIYVYGSPTVYFTGIMHRYEPNSYVYKISILCTSDWETFTNYANTYSKDVVGNAPITEAELETNYTLVGTDSTKTNTYTPVCSIQIDDSLFILTRKLGDTRINITKITYGNGTPSVFEIPVDDIYDQCYLYYNGNNIIITLSINDGTSNIDATILKIARIDTDLTNFSLFDDVIDVQRAGNFSLPNNLHNTPNGRYYIMTNYVSTDGIMRIYETNKRWE